MSYQEDGCSVCGSNGMWCRCCEDCMVHEHAIGGCGCGTAPGPGPGYTLLIGANGVRTVEGCRS